MVLTSLIGLSIYVPRDGDLTSLSGPAAIAAILGMSSSVAGLTLGFIAAVRSDNNQ